MKIRLLVIEDNENDLQQIVEELGRTGFDLLWDEVSRFESLQEYLDEIEDGERSVDLIVSEYILPDFNVADAILEVKERALEIPIIVLSDHVNEETIVKLMRLGAADYIYKDRLSRLGPAIVQAIYRFGAAEKNWHEDTTGLSKVNRLAAIFDIGRRAASILDIGDLLEETVRLIALRLGYSAVMLKLTDEEWACYPPASINGHGSAWSPPKRAERLTADELPRVNRSPLTLDAAMEAVEELEAAGTLTLPLKARHGTIGELILWDKTMGVKNRMESELMEILADQVAITVENSRMFKSLQSLNTRLSEAYDQTLRGWSYALELRDDETQEHTNRVADMSVRLGQRIGLSDEELVNLKRGALLHDVGKLGVPDRILMKEGDLTEEEWQIMRRHPEYAHQMLSSISYLQPALEIPYYHHEKWDGSGYPFGLKGKDIPLSARIFAVADVWDALRSPRPYRKTPWTEEAALEYITEQSGRHFDPEIVRIFLSIVESEKPQTMD